MAQIKQEKQRGVKESSSDKRHIYTVSELTNSIKFILEDSFAPVWVEGEISNTRSPLSGHIYFTLKDQTSQLACVLFRYVNKGIKFKIEDGQKAICYGRVSVYEKAGQYQLYVEAIEPKGLGALQLAFAQLKERLAKEGLFDESRKRPIPMLPMRIGVVTSPTGAAIRDILNVLSRRFANVAVILYPVLVQGEGAAEQITGAIDEFNRLLELSNGKLEDVDVLIVGRGGGSLEDLWAFNEEVVARAIYRSRIPVISAVGHQTDWTICDFVADLRAPTPSAAAEMVIAKEEEIRFRIENSLTRLKTSIEGRLQLLRSGLVNLAQSYILRKPLNVIAQYQQIVDDLYKELCLHIVHRVQLCRREFSRLAGKLEALSPVSILSRGYSITKRLPSGKIVKDSGTLKKGDSILTKLHKGQIISIVEKLNDK